MVGGEEGGGGGCLHDAYIQSRSGQFCVAYTHIPPPPTRKVHTSRTPPTRKVHTSRSTDRSIFTILFSSCCVILYLYFYVFSLNLQMIICSKLIVGEVKTIDHWASETISSGRIYINTIERHHGRLRDMHICRHTHPPFPQKQAAQHGLYRREKRAE